MKKLSLKKILNEMSEGSSFKSANVFIGPNDYIEFFEEEGEIRATIKGSHALTLALELMPELKDHPAVVYGGNPYLQGESAQKLMKSTSQYNQRGK